MVKNSPNGNSFSNAVIGGLVVLVVLIVAGTVFVVTRSRLQAPAATGVSAQPTLTPTPTASTQDTIASTEGADSTQDSVVAPTFFGGTQTFIPANPPVGTGLPNGASNASIRLTTIAQASASAVLIVSGTAVTVTPPEVIVPTMEPFSTATLGPSPTPTASEPASGTLIVVPPTAVPTLPDRIPQQQFIDVGTGKMAVLSVAYPATQAMKDAGINVSAPPAGNEWLLVEAIILCAGDNNCAPEQSAITVVGGSGQQYQIDSTLDLLTPFGPDGYNRKQKQVWGYLAFAIPTSEQKLDLVLTQGGKGYKFLLK